MPPRTKPSPADPAATPVAQGHGARPTTSSSAPATYQSRTRHADPAYSGGHDGSPILTGGDQAELLRKLEGLLTSTDKKTRFAPILDVSSLSGVHPSRELVYSEHLATGGSTRAAAAAAHTVWASPPSAALRGVQPLLERARHRALVLEGREQNGRHAIEHARSVELQTLNLAVTQAHRDDVLRHLKMQTSDNVLLKDEIVALRKNCVSIVLARDGSGADLAEATGAAAAAPPPPTTPAADDEASSVSEERRLLRELGLARQREFGLAWMVVAQQEQYLRGQVTLQEASLFATAVERFKAARAELGAAQREAALQGGAAALEQETRRWLMDAHAATMRQAQEETRDGEAERRQAEEVFARMDRSGGEALLQAEHDKQLDQLRAEREVDAARAAAALAHSEADAARARQALQAARADAVRTESSGASAADALSRALRRALLCDEEAGRARACGEEEAARAVLASLWHRALRRVDAEGVAAREAEGRRAEAAAAARAQAAARDFADRLEAAERRAARAEEAAAAAATEARVEAGLLRRHAAEADAAHARALREQEAELTVYRLQAFAGVAAHGEVEAAARDAVAAAERHGRARILCDARVAASVAGRARAEEAARAMEGQLKNARKHADVRDKMNAGLRRRLADAEAAVAERVAALQSEADAAAEQNSALRQEKGQMLNKVAMAEAKAGWTQARKTALADADAEELRQELVELHEEAERLRARPAVRAIETQTADAVGVDTASAACQAEAEVHAVAVQTPQHSRARSVQTDAVQEEAGAAAAAAAPPSPRRAVVLREAQWSHAAKREVPLQPPQTSATAAAARSRAAASRPWVPPLQGAPGASAAVTAAATPEACSVLGGAALEGACAGVFAWWGRAKSSAGSLVLHGGGSGAEVSLGDQWVDGKRTVLFNAEEDLGIVWRIHHTPNQPPPHPTRTRAPGVQYEGSQPNRGGARGQPGEEDGSGKRHVYRSRRGPRRPARGRRALPSAAP